MVASLDDLQKHSGSVLYWLGEDLEQVAIVIIIHQDFKFLYKTMPHTIFTFRFWPATEISMDLN